jgi:hypothetical protein
MRKAVFSVTSDTTGSWGYRIAALCQWVSGSVGLKKVSFFKENLAFSQAFLKMIV